jgi:DNA polymerase III alpha subunit
MDHMNQLYFVDDQGVIHMSDQGVIELAYQDLLDGAVFEWQNAHSKQTYAQVSEYLDAWPAQIHAPDSTDRRWFTPEPYKSLDLHAHVLNLCVTDSQRLRAQQELKVIEHLGVSHIFTHLVYLVDTWRMEGKVWGVGRGSSVSSFVLYAIGINRINPLDYDLCMTEFFKLTESELLNIIN